MTSENEFSQRNEREKPMDIEIDLVELLLLLWKRKWIIAITAFLGAAIAFAYTYFLVTPLYKASIMIYVNNSSISLGSASLSISSSDLTAAQKLVNTYIVILNSRTTLEEVIDTAKVDYDYEAITKMVSASPVNSTEIFQVTVVSAKPREAQKIANTIAKILPDRIADVVDGSSVRIVDYAVSPSHRDSPSYTKNTVIGCFLGFMLSAGIIVVKNLMDNHINSKNYLEQNYNIPILAVIPDMNNIGEGSYSYKKYYRKHSSNGGNN